MTVSGEAYFLSTKSDNKIQLSDDTGIIFDVFLNKELWKICSELKVGTPVILTFNWIPENQNYILDSFEIITNYRDRALCSERKDGNNG